MRFALDNAGGAGSVGKAVAEPPHSKVGWARSRLGTLRDVDCGGRRALRAEFWGRGGFAMI
jgi:hypothetical protein